MESKEAKARDDFRAFLEAGARRKRGARRRRANGAADAAANAGDAVAERVPVPGPLLDPIRARVAAASTNAPAATETFREALVFDVGGHRDVVLDVGEDGDVDDAQSSFREYFAAAPPPETGPETR